MRILNEDDNKSIRKALLLLTLNEAQELRDDLNSLIAQKRGNNHSHIDDLEYQHELTISIYDTESTEEFNQRIVKLIMHDE